MLAKVFRVAHDGVRASRLMNSTARLERRRDRSGGHPVNVDPATHLLAALDWLGRAQDATRSGGVSRGYSVAWNRYFRCRGWQAAYPETTGYIIPTVCDVAKRLGRRDLRDRALRMADWELSVQLPSGAVQSGVIGEEHVPTPSVFNTGQVLFGLVRAHRETGCDEYLLAARRAADYMLGAQDPDGRFSQGRSARARADCTTYYARAAWGLCELGVYLGERRFSAAAERNIRFSISRQLDNGWLEANCLTDPVRPLLHTIAYAIEGFLGCGLLLGREEYVRAAQRAAVALAAQQRPDGGLSGRFARDWSPQADWDCLTGDAQMATVWWQLGEILGLTPLQDSARRLCHFLMRTQNQVSADPGLAGGIKGSFPIDGDYGTYEILSWATKFFVDALLQTLGSEESVTSPQPGSGLSPVHRAQRPQ